MHGKKWKIGAHISIYYRIWVLVWKARLSSVSINYAKRTFPALDGKVVANSDALLPPPLIVHLRYQTINNYRFQDSGDLPLKNLTTTSKNTYP